MSWDVFIARFPKEAETPADIPSDWRPPPMASVEDVRSILRAVIPAITFDDADGRGSGTGDNFSVEVPLSPDDDPVTMLSMFFYGGGDAGAVAFAVAEALSARAIGTGGDGGFLTADNAEVNYASWKRYRDHVANALRSRDYGR